MVRVVVGEDNEQRRKVFCHSYYHCYYHFAHCYWRTYKYNNRRRYPLFEPSENQASLLLFIHEEMNWKEVLNFFSGRRLNKLFAAVKLKKMGNLLKIFFSG